VLKVRKTLVWNGPLGAFETRPFDARDRGAGARRSGADQGRLRWFRWRAGVIPSRRCSQAGAARDLTLCFDRRRGVSGVDGRPGSCPALLPFGAGILVFGYLSRTAMLQCEEVLAKGPCIRMHKSRMLPCTTRT